MRELRIDLIRLGGHFCVCHLSVSCCAGFGNGKWSSGRSIRNDLSSELGRSCTRHSSRSIPASETNSYKPCGLMHPSQRAGIGHIRPHDLRHTCASLLIAEGLNIKQVSSHLRHSSVQITLDTYGHRYPADRNEVAHAMDRVLGVAKNG